MQSSVADTALLSKRRRASASCCFCRTCFASYCCSQAAGNTSSVARCRRRCARMLIATDVTWCHQHSCHLHGKQMRRLRSPSQLIPECVYIIHCFIIHSYFWRLHSWLSVALQRGLLNLTSPCQLGSLLFVQKDVLVSCRIVCCPYLQECIINKAQWFICGQFWYSEILRSAHTSGVPRGGLGCSNSLPRNSEVLTKSNRTADWTENV